MPRATGIVLPEIKMCKSNGCANIATGYNGQCYSCDRRNTLRQYSESPAPRRTIKNPMGVEIECYNPETVSKVTHVARFVCRDGSLPSGGGEIKLCGPEAKLENIAADTVQRSRIVGNKVNKKCGLHVHMKLEKLESNNSRTLELCNRLFKFAKTIEDYMFDIVPQSRTTNMYCRRLEDVYGLVRHHSWISMSDRYPTLEVRIHGGTMNPWKVKGWINAWMQIRPYIDQVASGNDGWEEVLNKARTNGVCGLLDQNSIGYRYFKAREASDGTLYNFGFNTAVRPQARNTSETLELAPEDTPFPLTSAVVQGVTDTSVSRLLLERRTEVVLEDTIKWRYRNSAEGVICTNFDRNMAYMNSLDCRLVWEDSRNARDFFPSGSSLHRMWIYEGEIWILVEYLSHKCWVKMRNLPACRVFS